VIFPTTYRTSEVCVLVDSNCTVTFSPKGAQVIMVNKQAAVLKDVTKENITLSEQDGDSVNVFFKGLFVGQIFKEALLWRLPVESGMYLNPDPLVVAIALTKLLIYKDWENLEPILCGS
jgi:hypothetical protein